MNAERPLTMVTVEEAPNRFEDMFRAAMRRPVGISQDDVLVAYLVSKESIDRLFAKIEELEDQVWLKEAELGRQSGFATQEAVEKLISDVRNSDHGEARDSE